MWLAWLQLVWCVIVEVRAAARNVGVPARVPLSGGTQSVAHRLVTAALLLFSAAAALSPAVSHAAPPRPAFSVSAQAQFPGQAGLPGVSGAAAAAAQADATAASQATQHAQQAQKLYVVTPPHGRYHESLWEIAQQHLGDGRRYKEIFELNKDRVQPDGSKLTIASLIRPGWVLRMPGDAFGPGIQTAGQHQAQAPVHATRCRKPGRRGRTASRWPASTPQAAGPTQSPSSRSDARLYATGNERGGTAAVRAVTLAL